MHIDTQAAISTASQLDSISGQDKHLTDHYSRKVSREFDYYLIQSKGQAKLFALQKIMPSFKELA